MRIKQITVWRIHRGVFDKVAVAQSVAVSLLALPSFADTADMFTYI